MAKKKTAARSVLCIQNEEYLASLEIGKVYRTVADLAAEARQFVRVIDESKEDYLYPRKYFVPIKLPEAAARALIKAS
jgi:hypothetical protein